ncbi:hypothetical protein GW17_00009488, partial [Ensete ventricosum]
MRRPRTCVVATLARGRFFSRARRKIEATSSKEEKRRTCFSCDVLACGCFFSLSRRKIEA